MTTIDLSDISIIIKPFEDLKGRVTILEQQVEGLRDRLTAAESRESTDIGNIGTLVASNRQTISDLQSQIAALQAGQVTQATVDALASGISTLEANNTQLEQLAPAAPTDGNTTGGAAPATT